MKLYQKILNKKTLIVIILTSMFFIIYISYFAIQTSFQNKTVNLEIKPIIIPIQIEQDTLIAEANTSKQVNHLFGVPVRIKIPAIKIDTLIEKVGLTPDGAIDAPLGPKNTGWWKGGPIPGQIGNAIINGHSGWEKNIQAVFDNLKDLKKGDKIYITSSKGITTTFIVRELKIFDRNDEALDVFISNDAKSHLNIITCIGIWNVAENGRESRVVVFTDME